MPCYVAKRKCTALQMSCFHPPTSRRFSRCQSTKTGKAPMFGPNFTVFSWKWPLPPGPTTSWAMVMTWESKLPLCRWSPVSSEPLMVGATGAPDGPLTPTASSMAPRLALKQPMRWVIAVDVAEACRGCENLGSNGTGWVYIVYIMNHRRSNQHYPGDGRWLPLAPKPLDPMDAVVDMGLEGLAMTRWLGEKGSFEAVRLLRAVAEDLGIGFSFSW